MFKNTLTHATKNITDELNVSEVWKNYFNENKKFISSMTLRVSENTQSHRSKDYFFLSVSPHDCWTILPYCTNHVRFMTWPRKNWKWRKIDYSIIASVPFSYIKRTILSISVHPFVLYECVCVEGTITIKIKISLKCNIFRTFICRRLTMNHGFDR